MVGKRVTHDRILTYNTIALCQPDLASLTGPKYLTDNIIELYFSYLSSCHPSQDILLVPPSTSLWIIGHENLEELLEPLHLSDRKLVIFPIRSSDHDDVNEDDAENHWSLLVFLKNGEVFVHHDSRKMANREHARQIYEAVAALMNFSSVDGCKYQEPGNSPQQVNGYDCGLYVTATARSICTWFENVGRTGASSSSSDGNGLWFTELRERVNPSSVAVMRNELCNLFLDLVAAQNQINQ